MENKIRFSKNSINKAGDILIEKRDDIESLEKLAYWRNAHIISLGKATDYLLKIVTIIENKPLIAKRLKRAEAIINKLDRFRENKMKLSRMQDIAGCRVVLSNKKNLNRLLKDIKKDNVFELKNDYINNPKEDGYRSIHLIGKFLDEDNEEKPVELQLRTKVQHSWATALEIIDIFTKQSLKTSNVDNDWAEFFKKSSNMLALLDELNTLNSTSKKLLNLDLYKKYKEVQNSKLDYSLYVMYKLEKKLEILNKFHLYSSWVNTIESFDSNQRQDGYYLIRVKKIDKKSFEVTTEYYNKKEFELANNRLVEEESVSLSQGNYIVVLVSSTAIGGIKEAYPNYFADSKDFIIYISMLNKIYEKENPTFFRLINFFKYFFIKNKC